MKLTQERLKTHLHYDPVTGDWTWLIPSPSSKKNKGDRAGYRRYDGYLVIGILGRKYKAARLAFFYMLGRWPDYEVDHVNRDPTNNRWDNLREATGSQNQSNRGLQSNNTSGVIGVCWDSNRAKWLVQVNGIFFGRFDDFDEAVACRDGVAITLHGDFANLNSERNVS